MWPFNHFKKSKKAELKEPLSRSRAGIVGATMLSGMNGIPIPPTRRRYSEPTPTPVVVESNNGLVEGIIIGELLSGDSSPTPEPTPSSDFAGFGGGESGGAGAGGSYDAPSSDSSSSSDTTSSDTSSTDSGSSDSGSSSNDF